MQMPYSRILSLFLVLLLVLGPAGLSVQAAQEDPALVSGGNGTPVEPGREQDAQGEDREPTDSGGEEGSGAETEPETPSQQDRTPQPPTEEENSMETDEPPPSRLSTRLESDQDGPVECDSAQRLMELLNDDGVREVVLTNDILLTGEEDIPHADGLTTVYLGDFGITVQEGAWVLIYGEVCLVGNGVETPLLTLEDNCTMLMNDGWVEATGDGAVAVLSHEDGSISSTVIADGRGATAMEFHSSSTTYISSDLYARGDGGIAARGTAETVSIYKNRLIAAETALEVTGDVELRDAQIQSNNLAVATSGSLVMRRCEIVGTVSTGGTVEALFSEIEGEISAGGEITLDLCYAQPEPEGATVLPRRLDWLKGSMGYLVENYGFCVASGEEPDLPDTLAVRFWGVESPSDYSHVTVDVLAWREVSGDAADVRNWRELSGDATGAVIGWLEPELDLPRYLQGAENLLPKMPVRLYHPQQPFLTQIDLNEGYGVIHIKAAQSFVDAQEVLLHVSVDDGETWSTYSSQDPFGNTFYKEGRFSFFLPVNDTAHLFQMEAVGGSVTGSSNILRAWYSEDGVQDPITGDREGDGRDDDKEPGGSEPPVTGTQGGGGRSSTGGGNGGVWRESTDATPDADTGASAEKASSDGETPLAVGREADNGEPAVPVIAPATQAAAAPPYPEGAAVYTAAELAALALANPERVVFLAGDLRASLSTPQLLEAVGNGSFAILLEESGQGFHIRLFGDGGELEELGGAVFRVSLPLLEGYEQAVCTGEESGEIPVLVEEGRIVCHLTRTGRYEITLVPVVAAAAAGSTPTPEPVATRTAGELPMADPPAGSKVVWIALCGIAVVGAGMVAVLRLRGGRRG